MDPVLRGALAVTLVACLTRAAELRARPWPRSASPTPSLGLAARPPSARAELADAPCPRATLPDGNVCVPVPDPETGGQALSEAQNEHRDRKGQLRIYDQIPRSPDR